MIPLSYIREWNGEVPWQDPDMVEQDLIISRSLVEIFSDNFLAENLAFRGGTALNKLYLQPPLRYSEDIDLVQIKAMPIKETIMTLQKRLAFLGKADVKQKANNNTLVYKIKAESVAASVLKLKIEINCREHFSVMGYRKMPYSVISEWFNGECSVITYFPEELAGTKLRALYQRKKGRDLYDLYHFLTDLNPDKNKLINCYREYMKLSPGKPPTRKLFLANMEEKMNDPDFLGDTTALLRPDEGYDSNKAWDLVRAELIETL